MNIKSYRDKNGELRYKFNAYLGTDDITGKEIRTNRSGFTSKKQAELAYANLRNENLRRKKNPTFKEIGEKWLELYNKTVKYSSYQRTKSLFNTHIYPFIGNKPLKSITTAMLQELTNRKSKELASFSKINAQIKRVFDYAISRDIVDYNPALSVIYPITNVNSVDRYESIEFWEKDELKGFLAACKKDLDFMWFCYFWILSYTGMRKSELQALEWADINFDRRTININKSLSVYKDNKKFISSTKTKNSTRIITIDSMTVKFLLEWKQQQSEIYKKTVIKGKTQKYVFTDKSLELTSHNAPRKRFLRVLKNNDLRKIRLHSLRHTHASLCFEAGMDIKDVQHRLGHSNIETTLNIYVHISKIKERKSISKFEDFMSD